MMQLNYLFIYLYFQDMAVYNVFFLLLLMGKKGEVFYTIT